MGGDPDGEVKLLRTSLRAAHLTRTLTSLTYLVCLQTSSMNLPLALPLRVNRTENGFEVRSCSTPCAAAEEELSKQHTL